MNAQLKVIRTEADYDRAMERLTHLMDAKAAPRSAEDEELGVLAVLIASYEEKKWKDAPVSPVAAIKFRMDNLGLKPKDLVPYIGSMPRVSEVLAGHRPLSINMMRRLRKGLGVPASALIDEPDVEVEHEQPDYDYSKFPLIEMMERGYIRQMPSKELKQDPEKYVRPFLKSSPTTPFQALLRAPLTQSGARTMDEYALIIWRAAVAKKAAVMDLKSTFDRAVITTEWLRDVAKLSVHADGPRLAQKWLANYGIALVIEKGFAKTYLDGAAMMDGNQPIVALTLRHDRIDNFWFALLHELVHVWKHLKKGTMFIADNLDDTTRVGKTQEDEADAGATEALIPKRLWDKSAVKTSLLAEDALVLAKQAGVHPAIVAGRVRYLNRDWRLLSGIIRDAGQVTPFFADQMH